MANNYRANLHALNKAMSDVRTFSILVACQAKDPVEGYLMKGLHDAITGFDTALKGVEKYRDAQEEGIV